MELAYNYLMFQYAIEWLGTGRSLRPEFPTYDVSLTLFIVMLLLYGLFPAFFYRSVKKLTQSWWTRLRNGAKS